MVAQLQGKLAQQNMLRFKVSEKGALSVYGMGRFPIALYASQWERLLEQGEAIRDFISMNLDKLSRK